MKVRGTFRPMKKAHGIALASEIEPSAQGEGHSIPRSIYIRMMISLNISIVIDYAANVGRSMDVGYACHASVCEHIISYVDNDFLPANVFVGVIMFSWVSERDRQTGRQRQRGRLTERLKKRVREWREGEDGKGETQTDKQTN